MTPRDALTQYHSLICKAVRCYAWICAWSGGALDEDDLRAVAQHAVLDARASYDPERGASEPGHVARIVWRRVRAEANRMTPVKRRGCQTACAPSSMEATHDGMSSLRERTPAKSVADPVERMALRCAWERLTGRQREALVMRAQGAVYAEIGVALGVSTEGARDLCARGTRALRRGMEVE